jgi:hypothetical protein
VWGWGGGGLTVCGNLATGSHNVGILSAHHLTSSGLLRRDGRRTPRARWQWGNLSRSHFKNGGLTPLAASFPCLSLSQAGDSHLTPHPFRGHQCWGYTCRDPSGSDCPATGWSPYPLLTCLPFHRCGPQCSTLMALCNPPPQSLPGETHLEPITSNKHWSRTPGKLGWRDTVVLEGGASYVP